MVYSQEVVTEKAETPPQELPQQPPQQETSESALSAEEARQAQEDAANCKNYVQIQQDVSLKKTSRIDNQLFNGLEGKTIRNILFKTVDVFDEENPKENNRLYLFLNDLHFNTRAYVVESQLLFHVGEPLNVKNIHESERILRTRDYLTNAYVVPVVVCDDQVDLLVVTQDSWALEPRVSFSHKSGDNETGFGISDGNILGSGNALTIIYSENEQRNGVGYDFSNPHFLNREIDFRVYYEDTNDGRNSIINVSRPFYSLETPWATGIKLEDTSLIENIRSRGETINEFRHQTLLHEFFIGKATDVSSNYTQRWLLGLSHEEETFYPTPETVQAIPDEDKATYPWIEYQYHDNKFGVYKNVNQIQRPEDMALGRNFSFRLGVGGTTFDNPDDVVRYRSAYTHIMDIRDIHIFEYSVKIDGRQHLQIDGLDPVILSTSMSYNYFIDEKNRWYSRVSYDVGQDLAQQQELTVGGMTGLRGYPSDYFRGKKRYVFTLERRYFSDIHLFSLLRMGAVVYFDMGKAWGLDSDPYSPLLSDVGIGLRFASTKVRIGNVIHVDVAMPTSARSGISEYQLTIGAQKQF
ncbi:MAG TPA: hypothetical protein VN030_10280 [Cellvibrio sp.]|nr:hypothetical protein [Cellvibrio sp.]